MSIRPGPRRLKKQEKARIYAAIERVEMRPRVSCANEPLTPYLQRRDVRRTKSRFAFGDQRGIEEPAAVQEPLNAPAQVGGEDAGVGGGQHRQ